MLRRTIRNISQVWLFFRACEICARMKLVRNVGCRLRRAVRFLVNTTWLVLVFRLLGSGAPSAHSRKRTNPRGIACSGASRRPALTLILVQTRLARKLREKGRRSRDDLKK
ncbi:unnamed protein product [Oikopleura dioica]|uniref:Uncharacterized protein n=1 Tax=Oikopleura dioica TaxID=34765 RepID=E4XTF6_OIKDI|nr:unnamed protein product [Oikopleura dioica]